MCRDAGARRALIIQSGYRDLDGFANSAACMTQLLGKRGFAITSCAGPSATRDGILAAYRQLITDTGRDDAVVVYYVGHGALTTNLYASPNSRLPRFIQNICPSDYGETTDDDFRGISTWELSLLLAELTAQTTNVTIVLECCHAAELVRSADTAKTRPVPALLTRVGLIKHLDALRAQSHGLVELELAGNPHAVRVAACGQGESSFQVQVPSRDAQRAVGIELEPGAWIGGMTLRLAEILAQVGEASVAWRSIAAELRARVHTQQPEIEGPIRRVPFSLTTIDADIAPARLDGDVVTLGVGQLFGVSVGDVYAVMPAGATRVEPAEVLAELTIETVTAATCTSRAIRWQRDAHALPTGAVAIARSRALLRYPVQVSAGAAEREAIDQALAASRLLCAASSGEATLRVQDGVAELRDAHGLLLDPLPFPQGLGLVVRTLEDLATEARLRALQPGAASLDVSVELLIVGDRRYHTVADHGAVFGLADRVALRLTNGSTSPVYANVFNIGLQRRIALLSSAALGLELPPRGANPLPAPERTAIYVGATPDGALTGFELGWPAGLPRDQARRDTMLVVLTDEPIDLSVLLRDQPRDEARTRSAPSPLQILLDQLATGATRSAASPSAVFAMRWLDYQLVPVDASLDAGAPEVDASPLGAVPQVSPASVAIHLDQLAVTPGTRLDVLVCTPGTTPYRATTVLDAAPATLEVWSGALREPAELYVWTSKTTDRTPLAELLTPIEPDARLAAGARLAATACAALRRLDPKVATAYRGVFGSARHVEPRATPVSAAFSVTVTPSACPLPRSSLS